MPVFNPAEAIVSGLIAMWSGTIATIPTGWILCDGNGGSPNLLAKFVEGVATAITNPGATGGSTAKALNSTTSANIWADGTKHAKGAGGDVEHVSGGGANDTLGYAISDIRPIFYDIAFIYKT